jgi:hypothetical protein
MNKKEAEIALQQGNRITHKTWSSTEYIYMENEKIYMKNGRDCNLLQNRTFWLITWDSGWLYYNKIVPQKPAKEKMYTKAEVKQLAFYAVQYASKLEAAGQKSIHKTDIDNYLDLEM